MPATYLPMTVSAPTTAPKVRKGGGPRSPGEEICHLVEWAEPDRALCGKDVSGYPWDPPWPACVVCVEIARGLGGWERFFSDRGLDL